MNAISIESTGVRVLIRVLPLFFRRCQGEVRALRIIRRRPRKLLQKAGGCVPAWKGMPSRRPRVPVFCAADREQPGRTPKFL